MRRRKQPNLKKRPRNSFLKGSTNKSISLEKKVSKRMPMKKLWDHAIEVKEVFVRRKGKVY